MGRGWKKETKCNFSSNKSEFSLHFAFWIDEEMQNKDNACFLAWNFFVFATFSQKYIL